MLWSEEAEYTGMELGLWLWFAAECLDSVGMRREIVIYRLFHLNHKMCHEIADLSLSLSLSLLGAAQTYWTRESYPLA